MINSNNKDKWIIYNRQRKIALDNLKRYLVNKHHHNKINTNHWTIF